MGSPEPHKTPRTGTRLLLHSSSSPHGATGNGEGSAELQPAQMSDRASDSFSGLQNAHLSPCKSSAAGKGQLQTPLSPLSLSWLLETCRWVGTPQSKPARCCKDAHPELSTAWSCFGSAGETGSTARRRRRRRGRLASRHGSACISQLLPPNQVRSDSHRTFTKAVTLPKTLGFRDYTHVPPCEPPPLAPGLGTRIHFHPG